MPSLEVNGIELEYELSGSGGETVVLVHGELLDRSSWDATVTVLSGRYRVLRYDRAGHGGSGARGEDPGLERSAADLGALLDGLEIGPCHVVAHSSGAVVAARWAAAHPERSLSLSLADAFGRVDASLAAKLGSWLAALEGGGPALCAAVVAPWLWGGDSLEREPGRVEVWRAGLARAEPAALRAALEAVRDLGDQRKHLRAFSCPTLVAVGSQDVLTSMAYSHEIVEWVRHGVLVTVTGGGHLAPLEKPDEFNRVLLGFLERYQEFVGGLSEWQDDELGEPGDDGAEFHDFGDLPPFEPPTGGTSR